MELCTGPTADDGVDLTKLSQNSSGTRSPVWRLIMVDGSRATEDPDDPTSPPPIERAVYFVAPSATTVLPSGGAVRFYPNASFGALIAPVLPGRYTLIGPGDPGDTAVSTTYLGFNPGENPSTPPPDPDNRRRILLAPDADANLNQVAVYNNGTREDLMVPDPYLTIQPRVAVVISEPQRLSISEPDAGYHATLPLPEPEDMTNPLFSKIKLNQRSDKVMVVHLQRLANPLLPHDPTSNPYRTIDTMPIDLTAFNGIDTTLDPQAMGTSMANIQFYARQRGQNNTPVGPNNLWRQELVTSSPTQNTAVVPPTMAGHNFNQALHHSLGYLNDPFGVPSSTAGYVGDPPNPFPWLTWNNRPFVSQLELMQVPVCKSATCCFTTISPQAVRTRTPIRCSRSRTC